MKCDNTDQLLNRKVMQYVLTSHKCFSKFIFSFHQQLNW